MSTSNEEAVKKAITAADALASAGKLNPDQVKKFVDYVVEQTTWGNYARTVVVTSDTWELNKIGVGNRVMVPKDEATDPGVRRGVTTSKITLVPTTFAVPFEISDEFADFNVEGEAAKERIVQMMAKQLANNTETLAYEGDTLGVAVVEGDILEGGSTVQVVRDPFLRRQTGWLRSADSGHIVDAANESIGATIYSSAIQAMPTKFRNQRANLRWLEPADVYQLWLERLTTRATVLGDAAIGGGATSVKPFGIEAVEVPLLPKNVMIVEHFTVADAADVKTLRYNHIVSGSEIVTLSSLANTPTTKFVITTDYAIDYTNGTFNKVGGAIADGATVKVCYQAPPSLLLAPKGNLIVAFGKNVTIEKGRSIFRGVDQYILTVRVAVGVEETDALVKVKNIKSTL